MSLSLAVFNFVNLALPFRGFFALRRWWLRRSGIVVGRNVRIAAGAKIVDHFLCIGDDVWVGPEALIMTSNKGTVRIGSRVGIGPAALLVTGSHKIDDAWQRTGEGTGADIVIGDGCMVCARSVILGGARIGQGCVVAAGAVVTPGDYPDNVLLAGVPASVKRELPV